MAALSDGLAWPGSIITSDVAFDCQPISLLCKLSNTLLSDRLPFQRRHGQWQSLLADRGSCCHRHDAMGEDVSGHHTPIWSGRQLAGGHADTLGMRLKCSVAMDDLQLISKTST